MSIYPSPIHNERRATRPLNRARSVPLEVSNLIHRGLLRSSDDGYFALLLWLVVLVVAGECLDAAV